MACSTTTVFNSAASLSLPSFSSSSSAFCAPSAPQLSTRPVSCPAVALAQTHSKNPVLHNQLWRSNELEQIQDDDDEDKTNPQLRHVWREIQGRKNWEGMLDTETMNPLLQKEIMRYGKFAEACYEALDMDSRGYGRCKYQRREFLRQLGLGSCGYRITRYLYANPSRSMATFLRTNEAEANWMGFVAVASDPAEIRRLGRRDVVIAWRGTVTVAEWMTGLMFRMKPALLNPSQPQLDVMVESGFLDLYTRADSGANIEDCTLCMPSARQQVQAEIKRLLHQHEGEQEQLSITVTGHSLGSALAMITAYDIAETGLNTRPADGERIPITVFSFAGPRVGNAAFKRRCEDELGLRFLRVVNVHDGVPKVPGVLFNECTATGGLLGSLVRQHYCHVGSQLALDYDESTVFINPAAAHDLHALLQLVARHPAQEEKGLPLPRTAAAWLENAVA